MSYEEAAVILGCQISYVAKLVVKGELTSLRNRGGSLNREEVEALAVRRAERTARAGRALPRPK